MALAKTGYTAAVRGTTKEKVNLNSAGQIAVDGDTVAGTKQLQLKTSADNSRSLNHQVFKFFLSAVGAVESDSLSNKFTVTWE